MTTHADIVLEARSWIGSPFHHQGRLKGIGIDCGGLIIGVGKALGVFDYDAMPRYGRQPSGTEMQEICDAYLDRRPYAEMIPGNIALMAFVTEPQHLGIISDLRGALGLIHVYAQARKCVEHQLDDAWRARIRSIYSYRGLSG